MISCESCAGLLKEFFTNVKSRLLSKEMQNQKGFARRLKAASVTFKSKQAHPRGRSIAAITDGGLFSAFYQLRSTFPFTSPSHESSLMSCCWISNFLRCSTRSWLSEGGKSVLKIQGKLLGCCTKTQDVELLSLCGTSSGVNRCDKTPQRDWAISFLQSKTVRCSISSHIISEHFRCQRF